MQRLGDAAQRTHARTTRCRTAPPAGPLNRLQSRDDGPDLFCGEHVQRLDVREAEQGVADLSGARSEDAAGVHAVLHGGGVTVGEGAERLRVSSLVHWDGASCPAPRLSVAPVTAELPSHCPIRCPGTVVLSS
jgi:hypothetical protein